MPSQVVGRPRPVIGRLVQSADFERVLRTRTRLSSAHFALHHLAAVPSKPAWAASRTASTPGDSKLSTDSVGVVPLPVEDVTAPVPANAFGEIWIGAVVPKRHAKRSVTRTLLKRQIRSTMTGQHALLASGLWIVRLRAPFDRGRFPSAASEAMKRAARGELEQLVAAAAGRLRVQPVRR